MKKKVHMATGYESRPKKEVYRRTPYPKSGGKSYFHSKTMKNKNPHLFLLVYSNNCGHCTPLIPIWTNLQNINTTETEIKMIEAMKAPIELARIRKRFHLKKTDLETQGYPSMFHVYGKRVEKFDLREEEALKNKMFGVSSKTMKNHG